MLILKYIKSFKRILSNILYLQIIAPIIIQPLIIVFISFVLPDSLCLIALTVATALGISIRIAKNELRSSFLYFWIVLSISYIIIAFESFIIPLAEIQATENYFLMLFTLLSLFFLYLTTVNTKTVISNFNSEDFSNNEPLLNENDGASLCPVCRIKMEAKNYHCSICQECIPYYDHHSYWLNCCISGENIHLYFFGIFFGVFALVYGSLLMLTTICSPDFYFGILLPEDCSDVCSDIESCSCLVCGIYCLELALILIVKVAHHFWLISKGISTFEWTEKLKHHSGKDNSFNRGFVKNWVNLFKKFRKLHIEI